MGTAVASPPTQHSEPVVKPGILVVNRHHYNGKDKPFPEGYRYLGRPHSLSNPYAVKEYGRQKALELFRPHLKEIIKQRSGEAWNALAELASEYAAGNPIALGCSCAPNECHLDDVKKAVIWLSGKLFPDLMAVPEEAPASPVELRVGDRVQHVNPLVVWRGEINGKTYKIGDSGDRPRRKGTILEVSIEGRMGLAPGMVSVLWDDAKSATVFAAHPFKDGHISASCVQGQPDIIPAQLLEKLPRG